MNCNLNPDDFRLNKSECSQVPQQLKRIAIVGAGNFPHPLPYIDENQTIYISEEEAARVYGVDWAKDNGDDITELEEIKDKLRSIKLTDPYPEQCITEGTFPIKKEKPRDKWRNGKRRPGKKKFF